MARPLSRSARVLLLLLPATAAAQSLPPDGTVGPGVPAPPVPAWNVPPEPSVVVTGEADVARPPDEAEVVVGGVAQASSAAAAQSALNASIGRVIEALEAAGVPPRNLRSTGISVQPVYEMSGTERDSPEIRGYRATNAVAVIVDPARVGPVIDAAMKAGANRIEGVTFRLRDDTMARRTVLREAFREARAKAQAIASEGGFRLGEVLEVVETIGPVPELRTTDWTGLTVRPLEVTPVEPGTLELRAGVSVRFAIGEALAGERRTGGGR